MKEIVTVHVLYLVLQGSVAKCDTETKINK